jgi:APA family basic amino acid/polyamine antiporter
MADAGAGGPASKRAAALGSLAEQGAKRTLGSPALFAISYSTVASSVYFSLGAVSGHALGLTPVVFLVAGLFFVLCQMTYVEGASLHQERAGSTVFARYAFNELWSFVAGWALLLDGVILIALCAFSATNYLAAFYSPLGSGTYEVLVAAAIIAGVAVLNVRGERAARLRTLAYVAVLDVVLLGVLIVVGAFTVLNLHTVFDPVHLGTSPSWRETVFGLTVAAAAFTGLESASGLAGEVAVSRRGLRRLVVAGTAAVLLVYVGVSTIALSALPASGHGTGLSRKFLDAPLLGVASRLWPGREGSDIAKLVVGATGTIVLVVAANAAMLGLSRLAYSLARNRQIPSAVGRLHPRYGTPVVVVALAAVMATGLVIPEDLDFLIGIFAFGAMLAFTLAHISVIVLRYREPGRERPYAIPLSIPVGGGSLPLPAVLGALMAGAGWVSVLVLHQGARYVGLAWMALGLLLYVTYRRTEGKSLYRRVEVPELSLRKEAPEAEYSSILVPLLGTRFDDDLIQTAGRLATEEDDDDDGVGAEIEALWVFELPMSLPLDARLPEGQWQEAKDALARAKAVGEEYGGVVVHGTRVRARRTGQAIVEQAGRRAVEAIVMGAEQPSRTRGGTVLGGLSTPENFIGEVTRYVIEKAPCRVVLTAPPTETREPGEQPGSRAKEIGAEAATPADESG